MYCSGSACFHCTEGSGSSTLVISYSSYFLKPFSHLFSFFSVSNNNLLFLFPEVGDSYCSIFDAIIYKSWVYYRLNGVKLTGMVYYSCKSLVILVNDAKYIPPSSHLKIFHIASIIYSFKLYFFRYKCWLSYLSAT